MIEEQTLSHFIERLEALEDEVQAIKNRVSPLPSEPLHFEFILYANEKEVWRGLDLEQQCRKILRETPNAQIAIDWDSSPMTFV